MLLLNFIILSLSLLFPLPRHRDLNGLRSLRMKMRMGMKMMIVKMNAMKTSTVMRLMMIMMKRFFIYSIMYMCFSFFQQLRESRFCG